MNKKDILRFQKFIYNFYKKNKRDSLPWRIDTSVYSILVSEIMLQQTQVSRVFNFYTIWMEKFPNFTSLSKASFSDILKVWKGLGYNNRAKRLHDTSKIVASIQNNDVLRDFNYLVKLPGIGNYTAGAILNFSNNTATPMIETNIRRVFIHYFFKDKNNITDKEILLLVKETLDYKNPREWFYALMDYGAYLPKQEKKNENKKSKHYTKQSTFKNSNRFFRAKILSVLTKEKHVTMEEIFEMLNNDEERAFEILTSLEKDGMIRNKYGKYVLNES